MRLVYHRTAKGNFGDDLNPWLWSSLIPEVLDDDPGALFLGVGTIIRSYDEPGERHVFGAGTGYDALDARDRARHAWRFHCVRGPLTARALGLDAAVAITDPAMLVRRLWRPPIAKRHRVAFMPHTWGAGAHWRDIAAAAGQTYIDPGAGPFRVLHAIAASDLLVTEAMHGAIVADALRVPWVPVKLHPWVLDFKWRDWSATIGVPHRFEVPRGDASWATPWAARRADPRASIASRWVKRRLAIHFLRSAAKAAPRMSRDAVLDALEDRLMSALDRFRASAIVRTRPASR